MAGVDAFGTQFRRAGAVIGNCTDLGGPERSRESLETTAHDSADQYREFIPGLKDGGEVTLTLNYDPTNATHELLDDDFDEQVVRDDYGIVVLPDTEDEVTWELSAFITDLSDSFPHDDKMEREVTLKVTGKPVLVATGS